MNTAKINLYTALSIREDQLQRMIRDAVLSNRIPRDLHNNPKRYSGPMICRMVDRLDNIQRKLVKVRSQI